MTQAIARTAVRQNIRALMDFLQRFAPFNHMEEAHLALFVEHCTLTFHADGDVILRPEDGVVRHFHVVRQGQVQGERLSARDGRVETTFEISQGECFPLAALIGERPTHTLHRAVGDTFCLRLEHDTFVRLFAQSDPFRDYCLRGVSSLLDHVNRHVRSRAFESLGATTSLDATLDRYALRNPIVCSPDTPVQRAVARMHDANVGSIVITDDQRRPIGIFTLRDLRALITQPGQMLEVPIHQVMTLDPHCLSPQETAFDAALCMAEHHCSHVCLVDNDHLLQGVVSERDLFSLQRVDLVHLARTMATAPHLQTLVALRTDVGRLVEAMLAHGAASGQIMKIITSLNDCTVRRVIELNLRRHDPGIPFTWLAFGSEGRREQTLVTDQDNGILFDVPPDADPDALRARLLPFAEQVNADLAACGFTLCKGQIMASNPRLCLSTQEWEAWFSRFIDTNTPQNLLNSSIFLDMRPVFGPLDSAEMMFSRVRQRIRKHTLFQRMLAGNALQHRPPLNLFRGFVYAKGGERHTLDLKTQGLTPFVDAARLFALAHGIATPNTLERIDRLAAAGVFDAKDANAWIESYNLIQLLRMRNHQEQLSQGREPNNRVDPDQLNQLDRRILRESFRQAQRLQQKLALAWQL